MDSEIQEFLNNLIRIGKVSSVNYQKGTARVYFPDDDGIVSYDLPVLHRNALKNKDYNMPDIDERVLCLFLSSGVETGFILGSIYTDIVPTPESTGDKRTVVFEDGSRFSYDRKTHQFDGQIEGTTIKANRQDIEINTPHDVKVTTANNVEVTAANAVTITGTNNVTVNTKTAIVNAETAYTLNTQTATLNAPAITLNGDVAVTGKMIVAVDVIADRISLVNHTHNGNLGAPTSAPIKPQ